MASKKPPLGSPADLVEIFRTFLHERLEWDLTLDPWLMFRILELAELGLDHQKSLKRTKQAQDRHLEQGVRTLAKRYGTSEAKVRKRLRGVSKNAGYRSDDALRKRIDRIRRPWLSE